MRILILALCWLPLDCQYWANLGYQCESNVTIANRKPIMAQCAPVIWCQCQLPIGNQRLANVIKVIFYQYRPPGWCRCQDCRWKPNVGPIYACRCQDCRWEPNVGPIYACYLGRGHWSLQGKKPKHGPILMGFVASYVDWRDKKKSQSHVSGQRSGKGH